MTISGPTIEVKSDEAVREPRMAKLVAIDVSSSRHQRTRIVVRNLSPHGLGARGEIDLLPCEHVVIHLPDGSEMGAIVRWVRKNSFGLSLDDRIDAAALRGKSSASSHLITRDAQVDFHRMQHKGTFARSGFNRSHREEVLRNSDWIGEN